MKEIILPVENLKEAEAIPAKVLEAVKLTSVQTIEEGLGQALLEHAC